jgi:uncharacterized protein YggU (UPF0235/DUF167 family)
MTKASLSHLARPGAVLAVRATPRASRTSVALAGDVIRVHVTSVPEDGKANRAVAEALAEALGVARTRLTLLTGASSRDKRFRLD